MAIALLLAPGWAWGGPAEAPDGVDGESEAPAIGLGWLFEGFNRVDVEGEALLGSDITVLRTSAAYEQQRGKITVGATLGYTDIDIDYMPVLFGIEADRSESSREAQVDLSWEMRPTLELSGFARAYEGYPDYRTVWIAEALEQDFGFVPGFTKPDPKGWALGGSVVWDAVPGATRVTGTINYGEDDIVPAWAVVGPMVISEHPRLETISSGLVWEQAINGWLKMQNSFQLLEVSGREPRFQIQTDWAAALGPKWTLRGNAGATRERPNFEAYFGGGMIDFEFLPGWHVALNARYYEDTGEIETSGPSTSAPGLHTFELGGSLLYDRGDLAVRLYGGFYNTEYEALERSNRFFGRLYRDRDWWVTRLALSYSF